MSSINLSFADGMSFGDSLRNRQEFQQKNLSFSDGISGHDGFLLFLSGPSLYIITGDCLAFLDSAKVGFPAPRSVLVGDNILFSDFAQQLIGSTLDSLNFSDSLSLLDGLSIGLTGKIGLAFSDYVGFEDRLIGTFSGFNIQSSDAILPYLRRYLNDVESS